MKIGVVGLGRMGGAIAGRLASAGHDVFGFDFSEQMQNEARDVGVTIVQSLSEMARNVRIFWLMVPAGDPVDLVIQTLKPFLQPGDTIIDGGNSKFVDTVRRAKELEVDHISFIDCGTSGGLYGKEIGFCLMIGGKRHVFNQLEPIFAAVACADGYAYIGQSGAGHYVKMVHNGIEYALMQSYAEGLHLIKDGYFKDEKIDLEMVAHLWNNGSIIRSWLLSLTAEALKEDQSLATLSGYIAENGMGQWTIEDAHAHAVEMPALQKALEVRNWSRQTGGNYATKVIAMVRNKMGGHAYHKKDS